MREILIYKPIGSDEKKHFLAEWFAREMGWAESDRDVTEMKVRFNCIGGSVFDGFAIISRMDESELTTNGMVDGIAASMGAFIALRCDRLVMNANAKLMLHLPQVATSGDAAHLRAQADKLDGLKERFAKIIANKAGITEEKAEELYLQPGTDTWLTAEEAKAAGLCDEIVGELVDDLPATAELGELYTFYAQLIDSNHNSNKMDKVAFMAALGNKAGTLTAQSSDDEFIAGVTAIVAENTQLATANTKLQGEVDAFKAEKAEAEKAEVTALITAAIEDKRITAEQKPNWEAMFTADHANAKAMLAGLTPVGDLNRVPQGGGGGGETPKAELVAKWDKLDRQSGALEALKKDSPEEFKAVYFAKWGKEPVMD
uniref:head maturation protease, ClpP-related n=1 Tax=uncultured Draconibacterium sp. TaxID=1573823 RepID=UPI003216591A